MVRCPACEFVGDPSKYGKTEGLDREKMRAALVEMKTSPPFKMVDGAPLLMLPVSEWPAPKAGLESRPWADRMEGERGDAD